MQKNSQNVNLGDFPSLFLLILAMFLGQSCGPNELHETYLHCTDLTPTPLCQLFEDLPAYQNKVVAVRGVYFFGLRDPHCSHKFVSDGRVWPTALELATATDTPEGEKDVDFTTDQRSWDVLDAVVIREGLAGHRAEIWVTVIGQILGPNRRAGRGSVGGYGHLATMPALLTVRQICNIEVKMTPSYDYREMVPSRLQKKRLQ